MNTSIDIRELARVGAVLNIRQVSTAVGTSTTTVRRWMREGYFPRPVVLGPSTKAQIQRWPAESVRGWLAEHGLLPEAGAESS